MCIRCWPGGRFLMSRVIFTPLGASESVAVPTFSLAALMILTVTGFGAFWANVGMAESASRSSVDVVTFMSVSVYRFGVDSGNGPDEVVPVWHIRASRFVGAM